MFELLTKVVVEYDCDSIAEPIEKISQCWEKDASELAQARDDIRCLRDSLPGEVVCVGGTHRVFRVGSYVWLPASFRR